MAFNRDNRSGGNRSFNKGFGNRPAGGRPFGGGNRFGGGRDSGRPQMMHKATCSECGNECTLPFRPSGDRPVFCSTCFEKRGGSAAASDNRPRFDKPSFGGRPPMGNGNNFNNKPAATDYSEQFKALNNKLDEILKALVTPEKTPKTAVKTKKVAKKVVAKKK